MEIHKERKNAASPEKCRMYLHTLIKRVHHHRRVFPRIIAENESSRNDCTYFHVPDDLDSDVLSRFVIQRSNHLAEAPLTDHLQYFVSAYIKIFYRLHARYSKMIARAK